MDTTNSSTSSADHDLLIEVNANVKNLTTTIAAHIESNNRLTDDHETRIRALEAEAQQLKGSQKALKVTMTVVSTLFGLVSAALGMLGLHK